MNRAFSRVCKSVSGQEKLRKTGGPALRKDECFFPNAIVSQEGQRAVTRGINDVTDYEARLTQDFCCLKCRGRSAVAKTLPVSRGLPHLLTLASDKYVFVTCTLCGFTEIYNPLVFATDDETAAAEAAAKMPQRL